jgi:hypothetical protein
MKALREPLIAYGSFENEQGLFTHRMVLNWNGKAYITEWERENENEIYSDIIPRLDSLRQKILELQ